MKVFDVDYVDIGIGIPINSLNSTNIKDSKNIQSGIVLTFAVKDHRNIEEDSIINFMLSPATFMEMLRDLKKRVMIGDDYIRILDSHDAEEQIDDWNDSDDIDE